MTKVSRRMMTGTLSLPLALASLVAGAAVAQEPDSEAPFARSTAPVPAPPPVAAPAPPRAPVAAPAAPPAVPAVPLPPPTVTVPMPVATTPPMTPVAPPYAGPPLHVPPRSTEVMVPRSPQPAEPEGPVASWEPLRFAITLEGRAVRPLQDGARRLADEKWPSGGGLSVQADVWRPSDRLAVRLDLGFTRASSESHQSGSSLREELETDLYQLGASLRYHLLPWLAPYARLSGGLGRDKLAVGIMKDRQWFGQGAAGAGVLLRSPSLRLWQGRFAPAFGLMGTLEGGYALASGSDFAVRASLPSSSENPIPATEVALGHVGRSAPYLRVSFGLAF